MTYELDATYSPEDNKLRLYAAVRLDSELFAEVKKHGFRWAPKQDLFVAPKWTPAREDFCLQVAGEITAEQSTLLERAEAKADRLETIADNKAKKASAFHAAADQLSERFAYGQPILVGHHSEKKARKDQERMSNAMDKAVENHKAVGYWNTRAAGTLHHANRKNDMGVIQRRIKTLLKELRDHQRVINHAHRMVTLWETISAKPIIEERNKAITYYSGAMLQTGSASPSNTWHDLDRGNITHDEALKISLDFATALVNSEYQSRWTNHILNRLGYERSALGNVPLFAGNLTAAILQTFARTHGAHKPKAAKTGDVWTISSSVLLPAHIAEGDTATRTADQWCEFMQSVGYTVPTPTPRKAAAYKLPPLINPTLEQAQEIQEMWNKAAFDKYARLYPNREHFKMNAAKHVTQAAYSERSKGSYSLYDAIELDVDGNARMRQRGTEFVAVCRVRVGHQGGSLYAPRPILVLSDKPTKPLPIELKAPVEAE